MQIKRQKEKQKEEKNYKIKKLYYEALMSKYIKIQ